MEHTYRRRAILIAGLALALLLLIASWAPGWGMPNQRYERQTVPELTPWAYLPFVARNYSATSTLALGDSGLPGR